MLNMQATRNWVRILAAGGNKMEKRGRHKRDCDCIRCTQKRAEIKRIRSEMEANKTPVEKVKECG
jgi:hypothetical protein